MEPEAGQAYELLKKQNEAARMRREGPTGCVISMESLGTQGEGSQRQEEWALKAGSTNQMLFLRRAQEGDSTLSLSFSVLSFQWERFGTEYGCFLNFQQAFALDMCTPISDFWYLSLCSLVQGPKGTSSVPPTILLNLWKTHQENGSLPGNQAVSNSEVRLVALAEVRAFPLHP